MDKQNRWHTFVPERDFSANELYEEICTTLIDKNRLEIKRDLSEGVTAYQWRIINNVNKVSLYGCPGQEIIITLTDKMQ